MLSAVVLGLLDDMLDSDVTSLPLDEEDEVVEWVYNYDGSERPALRLIRTADDAELVAMEWMRFFGFRDVVLTGAGADGGLDLIGSGAAGEVKMHGKPVGRPHLQKLHGAAPQGLTRVFFALAGYTPQAVQYADGIGTAWPCSPLTSGRAVPGQPDGAGRGERSPH